MNRSVGTAICPHCKKGSRCEKGEDGVPELETTPCQGSDTCIKRLCPNCDASLCQGCKLMSCSAHMKLVDEGGSPERILLCEICRREREQSDAA